MKTLFIPSSAIEKSIIFVTLISLLFWVYPETLVLAASGEQSTGQNTALVFEIKNPNTAENNKSITLDDLVKDDPLALNLKTYLEDLGSPLAPYAGEIIVQPQWQRALAISWVESNMCIHHYNNNCSGIGGAPGNRTWRKYPTFIDWFKDMSQLMEKPLYKERLVTFKQMKGVYVKPGSASWVHGAQDKYNELIALTEKSENQRQEAAARALYAELALATFPETVIQ